MRICFVTNATQTGGAERVLLETVDVLKERGIECRILLAGDGELAHEFAGAGVPYAFLDGGSWVTWRRPSLWGRAKAAAKIAGGLLPAVREISRWRCDAIYTNSLTTCGGALAARLLGLPHIWHLHEFGKEDHGVSYRFGEAVSNRAIGTLSSVCIVVSRALRAKYSRFIPASKLKVIYPSMHRGVTGAQYCSGHLAPAPGRKGPFRLVVVGGIVEGKGQADAVRALALLVRQGVDAELSIVGEPYLPYSRTVEELVRATSMSDRVQMVGRVRDASPYLQCADLVLVCSRSEAFGRVTIEAMLAGKAVVGAAAGATTELIQDGHTGFLYKPGDAEDLAAKIRRLAAQQSLLKQLAENGRRWASGHFTVERYASELMDVLCTVVPSPAGPVRAVPARA